jgi:hypothetical protein
VTVTRNRALLTWISEDCPNHLEGSCRGANLGPDWKLYKLPKPMIFCNPLTRCLVSQNFPCRFWEMGMETAGERHPELRDAIRDYRGRIRGWKKRSPAGHPFCQSVVGVGGPVRDLRECPECGGPLLPRKRLCDACKRRRRRETWRSEKRGQRSTPCPTEVAKTEAVDVDDYELKNGV